MDTIEYHLFFKKLHVEGVKKKKRFIPSSFLFGTIVAHEYSLGFPQVLKKKKHIHKDSFQYEFRKNLDISCKAVATYTLHSLSLNLSIIHSCHCTDVHSLVLRFSFSSACVQTY